MGRPSSLGLLDRVKSFVEAESLLERGDHVLAAVSGGADSMCLIDALTELRPAWDLTLSVAHFDHRLRNGSDLEGETVAAWCRKKGVPYHVSRWDRSQSDGMRGGLEAAAHDARYHFLESTASSIGAERIAFGHTADDQIETVLMHLLRGAGLRGLLGMAPKHGKAIRPLLTFSAEETRAWCVGRGISWIEDPSNAEPIARRNSLRRDVVPLLRQFNPDLHTAVTRATESLRVDFAHLTREARAATTRCVEAEEPSQVTIDRAAYALYDAAIRRRLLQLLFERWLPSGRQGDAGHLFAADRLLLEGATGQALSLPGDLELRVEYQRAFLKETSRMALSSARARPIGDGAPRYKVKRSEDVEFGGDDREPDPTALDMGRSFPRSQAERGQVSGERWRSPRIVEGRTADQSGRASSTESTAATRRLTIVSLPGPTVEPWKPCHLAVPGSVSPPGAGWVIEATLAPPPSNPPCQAPNVAWFDPDLLQKPLLVRSRAPGDRFTPSGMDGHQKVHDLLVNAKIPRCERGRVPMVLSGDAIVWVGGVRVAETARWRFGSPHPLGRPAVRLVLRRLTHPAR